MASLLQNELNGGTPAAAATAITMTQPVNRIRRQSPPISAIRSVRSSRMMTPAAANNRALGQAWVNTSKMPAP